MKKLVYCLLLIVFVIIWMSINKLINNVQVNNIQILNSEAVAPPSIIIDNLIKKYCYVYNIPEEKIRTCAKLETSYEGPLQFNYDPYDNNKISTASAVGVMQVQVICAREVWKDSIKNFTNNEIFEKLRFDVDFNIHTGVRHIYNLYKITNNWQTTFSIYNQGTIGKYKLNEYAKKF